MLASLESELLLGLAGSALQTQDDLLGGLGLLVEDRLGLTTVTGLLTVVTTLTLGEEVSLCRCMLVSDVRTDDFEVGMRRTLPALYWVTLCWVCFLHSLPLQ